MNSVRTLVLFVTLLGLTHSSFAQVSATFLGRFDTGVGEGAAEISTFDPESRRLFVANAEENRVDIVDLSVSSAPVLVGSIDIASFGAGINSVAVSGGVLAVAIESDPAQDPGRVGLFDVDGNLMAAVEVGALPDMVTFTPDGDTVLVANEGEPNDDYSVDPLGTISLIDLTLDPPVATHLTFEGFDAGGPRASELPATVRIFGPGASVSQDLEPEYIAVAPDGSQAWVTLQENSAVAIVDLEQGAIESIVGLGTKKWANEGWRFDASNRDGGIDLRSWSRVVGMYQPDAIAAFSTSDGTYWVTANEGDARDYDGFSEEARVEDLTLDPTVFPDAATLQAEENLGRLNTTTATGDLDGDGDHDLIYAYGARSFSIWDADGTRVFDSGDDFERITASLVPALFNSDESDPGEFDDRSDDKGPEPEAVVTGRVGDRTYAFIGLERVGGVMVYDVTVPSAAFFAGYVEPNGVDVSPEGLLFVDDGDSPTGMPLLIGSHEVSGTVGIWELSTGPSGPTTCVQSRTTTCLGQGRFQVNVAWTDFEGEQGTAYRVTESEDSVLFYFFEEDNWEMTAKVIDGCLHNGHYWVFLSAATNVAYEVAVTDTSTGELRRYTNPLGTFPRALGQTDAFTACP